MPDSPIAAVCDELRALAQHRLADKRGGGRSATGLPDEPADVQADVPAAGPVDYIALDDALTVLAVEDPAAAELVHLRFFAGRTRDESAALLGISPRQADRLWAFAKAWLLSRLSEI